MDTDMDGPGGSEGSEVMKRLEEGRQLPWRLVKHGTWTKLANKLDLPSPISNNDWRGLAEHLGFSTEDILVLETSKERNTLALFTNYLHKKDASVNNVAKALKQMNRDDALQILLDAVPDIEARYEANSHKSSMEGMEGDDTCITNMTQGGCHCLGSPTSLSCNSPHGAGGCSPCHTHSHHLHHPQYSMASGGCCCRHVNSMHSSHCHTPVAYSPHTPAPLIHPNPHSTWPASTSLRHGGMGVGGGDTHYNITPGGGQLESGYSAHAGGSSSSSPSPHSSARSSLLQHPHSRPSTLQPMSPYSHAIPVSMLVHQDTDSHHYRVLPSYHLTRESMEVDGGGEEPTPLHTAIARGQGLLSEPGGETLSMNVVTDQGEDTPSTSMEELSSSDSSSRFSSIPPNVTRQVSEECNAKQPFFATATSPRSRHIYDSGEGREGTAAGGVAAAGSSGRSQVNAFTNTKGSKDSQSSLQQLERLSQLPPCFKPDQKYTTMVAEQQMEEVNPGQRGSGRVHIKREKGSSRTCHLSSSDSGGSGGCSSGGKLRGTAGADTFPMRVKPQTGGATVDQVRSRQPGTLTKTTSVPIDMKVEEFKKAFRHIKVFVTYANESKQHCRQVLSLCNCLDRNGFSCCVDVNSRCDSADQVQDWCGRKFKEADFVLVCLSPLYLEEVKGLDNAATPLAPKVTKAPATSSKWSKGALHSAYIYQLMREEYQNMGRCSRFVPLYMEGSPCDAGPSWLTSHLSYQWPRQYKDLLWMLTKPEDRIKQKSKLSPQKGHNALKTNGLRGGHLVSSPFT